MTRRVLLSPLSMTASTIPMFPPHLHHNPSQSNEFILQGSRHLLVAGRGWRRGWGQTPLGQGRVREDGEGHREATQVVLVVKKPPASAGDIRDAVLIPGLGRSPGGDPLQYSCLENPMDRGAWQATVQRVAELDTTEATHTNTHRQRYTERCRQRCSKRQECYRQRRGCRIRGKRNCKAERTTREVDDRAVEGWVRWGVG